MWTKYSAAMMDRGWVEPYPSEFDKRDILPALMAAFVLMTGSDAMGALFLMALALRGVLWMLIDRFQLAPGARGMSPDRRT